MSVKGTSFLQHIISLLTAITMMVVMIFGTVALFKEVNNKILATAGDLMVLNDNIQFYNESYRKTDEMTRQCREYMKERQAIYDSSDFVIGHFARLPGLLKFVVLLAVIAGYAVVVFADLVLATIVYDAFIKRVIVHIKRNIFGGKHKKNYKYKKTCKSTYASRM